MKGLRKMLPAVVAGAVMAVSQSAFAVAQFTVDYTGATTEVKDQVVAALPVILPVAAGLIAVGIGWKYFRKFVK